jgi:GNAT superfamily N-acetyltransferase
MEVFDLKDKQEYLYEVMELEYLEWANNVTDDKENRINKKINKYLEYVDRNDFCKLILVDEDKLIGFISLFPYDGDEEQDLSPWYATMYVKKEYRGLGYSKLLNDAILKEARNRGFNVIYLKTELNNYYEKFGAIYMEDLNNSEKLYYIDLK